MSSTPNPWQYKPWWCQPWSIVLTGITLIAGSWWVFHRIWFTILVALPVTCWMGFFLLVWPRLIVQSGWLQDEIPPSDQADPENSGGKA